MLYNQTLLKNRYLSILIPLIVFFVSQASYGFSLFSGITVLEGGDGVIVLEIKPNTPMKNAGIKKGDVILEIQGERIKGMSEYVSKSRELKDKTAEAKVLIKRDNRIFIATIDAYSIPIKEYWNEKVPFFMEKAPENEDPYDYWIKQGKMKLDSIKEDTTYSKKIEAYRAAISDIFNGLHYRPKMALAVILIADTYAKIGETFVHEGSLNEGAESFKIAIRLYKKVVVRPNISNDDLMIIRDNLKKIETQLIQNLEIPVIPTP